MARIYLDHRGLRGILLDEDGQVLALYNVFVSCPLCGSSSGVALHYDTCGHDAAPRLAAPKRDWEYRVPCSNCHEVFVATPSGLRCETAWGAIPEVAVTWATVRTQAQPGRRRRGTWIHWAATPPRSG